MFWPKCPDELLESQCQPVEQLLLYCSLLWSVGVNAVNLQRLLWALMLQNYVKPYRRTWQRIIKFFIISRKKSSDWLTIVCLLQRPAFSRLLQRKVRREPWWVTLLKELPCITLWVTHCNTLHSHCPGLSRTPSNRFWRSMTPGKSSTSCVSTWWV